MNKRIQNSTLFALLFAVGCGTNITNSPTSPDLSTMPLALSADVGDNLVRHFSPQATKPPVNRQLPTRFYRFDFVEQERTLSPEGNGIIKGAFLFSINNQPPQRGFIEFTYTPEGSLWRKTNQVRIETTDIDAITLVAHVRDGESGQPLQNVAVEARRPDGVRTSRTVKTDETGRAVLEVLTGDFEIAVDHPNFQPTTLIPVRANMAHIEVGDIQLTPVNKLIRTP